MAARTASKAAKTGSKTVKTRAKKRKYCTQFKDDDIRDATQTLADSRAGKKIEKKRITAADVRDFIAKQGRGPQNSAKTPSLTRVRRALKGFVVTRKRTPNAEHQVNIAYLGRNQSW